MERYCPSCSITSEFSGEVCRKCERVARSCESVVAREYVAHWFADHPLLVPPVLLRQMQDRR